MKWRRIIVVLVVVVIGLSLWWWLRVPQQLEKDSRLVEASAQDLSSSATTPSPKSNEERRKESVNLILSMLNTPIEFYGKVIDQDGNPVPDANVGYSALDQFMAEGTGYTGKSDKIGLFSISGIKGARLSVNVRKDGYYFIDGKSHAAFAYGTGSDSYFREPPTKDNPAVFVLHKMGETEPLIMVNYRSFRIPKDGTPVIVDLETGSVSNTGQLKVEAWTGERDPNGPRFYDWKCRISVPGGGIIEREGQFDFEAPAKGYQEFDEIVMSKDAERWSTDSEKSYFLRLANDQYARISFKMIAQGDHFFRVESFLNPKPGSRNLEYDPKKRIKNP